MAVTLRGLIAVAIMVTAFVLVLRGVALPHSFYDQSCCSDNDCKPMAEAETPKPLPGGDWLLTTGEVVERRKVKWSPDGRYHLCRSQYAVDYIFCLYVPPQGS